MGRTSLRQFAAAAVLAISPIAASAADCTAGTFAAFVACAAAGGAGDTITLTANVQPDGTPVVVNANQSVVNNGFVLDGAAGLLQITGPAALTLPALNTYSGGTLVASGALVIGDAGSMGSGLVILQGGGILSLGSFAIGGGAILFTGSATIAAAPGQTLQVYNVNVNPGAAVILGDLTNNGTVDLGGAGAVDATSTVTLAGGTVRPLDATMMAALVGNAASTTLGAAAILDTNNQTVIIKNIFGAGQIINNTPGAVAFQAGTYGGVISGTGNVGKDTAGIVTFTGTNTYTGPTLIVAGELHIGNGGTTGTLGIGGGVDIGVGAALVYNRSDSYVLASPIAGGGTLGVNNATGTLSLEGTNTYTGPTLIQAGNLGIGNGGATGDLGNTSGVNNNGAIGYSRTNAYTITAPISGPGTLAVVGTGTLTLANANTYTGATIVNTGTLSVTSSNASSIGTNVDLGGTLMGTGTTGVVQVNTGNLRPGLSPGIINTGTLTLSPAATAYFEITGPVVGTGYDQINVTGGVFLNNASLNVTGAYVPILGDTFVLINNDGADPVNGTFGGIPEGTTAAVNGTLMSISYAGGDGNDVVLSVVTRTVTPGAAGPNGTIAPSTPQTVINGGTTNFTITPNAGYTASVGGTCPAGTFTPPNYTTGAITADCTVDPIFTLNTYTVTSSGGGPNGTITPPSQPVNHGSTAVFTVTPSAGYTASVGGTCPAGSLVGTTYTTGPITGPCDVAATFTLNTYTVTSSGGGANGTITPPSQPVNHGSTAVFTVTPGAGYTASVGGTCPAGSLVGTTYTTGVITAPCDVAATFALNSYTVTASAGANGTIAPPSQIVAHGGTTNFTVTPSAGYTAAMGGTCPAGSLVGTTYTTGAITAACTVTATFTQVTFTVTPSAGANGTITPNTPQTVASGATTTFTVTPNAGYTAAVGGTCGGSLVGTTYTTNAITANCTVAATFTQITFTVTPSAGANGTITPNTPQTVASGATTTFTVTPSAGYTATVGGTCGGALVGTTYTTNAITANCTVAATFTQVTFTVTPSAGANGTITPNTPQTVASGATTTFTVTPSAGFTATVGGTCGGALVGTTYTTNAITANCTVAATFAASGGTTYSAPTATGTGTATVTLTGGGAGCVFATSQFIPVSGHAASPPAGSQPAGVVFPHGLFDFTLSGCTPGSTVTLTITYPQALPAGTQYWKYGPEPGNTTPHWYVMPSSITGVTAVFSITDGLQGDDDLVANGTIVDQGGPGVPPGGPPVNPHQTPTLSEWALLLMAGLMLLVGMGGVRRRAYRGR